MERWVLRSWLVFTILLVLPLASAADWYENNVANGANSGTPHEADLNEDGQIDISELISYIERWIDDLISLQDVMSAIVIWTSPDTCGNGFCEDSENVYTCRDCHLEGFSGNNFGAYNNFYIQHPWVRTQEALDGWNMVFQETGMEIARMNMLWGQAEPEPGVYNWTLIDDMVDNLDSETPILMTIFCTGPRTKYWEARQLYWETAGHDFEDFWDKRPSAPPADIDEYTEFLTKLVGRYKSRIKYWMIDNEVHSARYLEDYPSGLRFSKFYMGTEQEYVEYLKPAYDTIKNVDPEATVMMANYMEFEPDNDSTFTTYVLENAKGYSDVLAINLYKCPEDDSKRIRELKSTIHGFGYDLPVWVSEHGELSNTCHKNREFRESFHSPDELELQSADLVKRYAYNLMEGVQVLIRLNLGKATGGKPPSLYFNHMSLTFDKAGKHKKPAFFTNKMVIEKLKDFESISKLSNGIYLFDFAQKEPVVVAWSNRTERFDASSVYTDQVRITHLITELGKVEPFVKASLSDSVEITEIPVFIEEYNEIIGCGNGICEGSENSQTCYDDCVTQPVCGDDNCALYEDKFWCPDDCGNPTCDELISVSIEMDKDSFVLGEELDGQVTIMQNYFTGSYISYELKANNNEESITYRGTDYLDSGTTEFSLSDLLEIQIPNGDSYLGDWEFDLEIQAADCSWSATDFFVVE